MSFSFIAIILGFVMSFAIDGSTPLLPTMLAGSVLLDLHWLLAVIGFHTDWF
jgi:hypothetical protein